MKTTIVGAIAALLLACAVPVQAQDRGAWFKSLKTPYGGSCCDLSDCRRTEAEWRLGEDGTWRWYARVQSYRGIITIPIPEDRVLDQPKSIDGDAYVCHTPGSEGGVTFSPYAGRNDVPASDPYVYCFVPPDMGS